MKKMTPMMIAASAIIALSSSAFAAVDDMTLMKTSHRPDHRPSGCVMTGASGASAPDDAAVFETR